MKHSDFIKSIEELTIYRGFTKAATLTRTSHGCQLSFDSDFLTNSKYKELAFNLPKSASPLELRGVNLHSFFAGLLPEGLRLRALVNRIKTSEDDLFSLFAAAGSHVIGDVHSQEDEPIPSHAKSLTLPKLKETDFYEYFDSLLLADEKWPHEESLAGVQSKISASMISFPLNIAKSNKRYILKLNPKDKPSLIRNELLCMTLAQKCGIATAALKIVKDKNQNEGLLVERFDRRWDKNADQWDMLHQEDACQFLNRYPADKYRVSFSEISKGIEKWASSPAASLLKTLRLHFFSYLIGNGDLHGKNISLWVDPASQVIDITPAYDILTTAIYGDRQMALMFDGKKDNITRAQAISFATRFQIPERAMTVMLDRLIQDLKKHKALLEKIPIEERKLRLLFSLIEKRSKDLA